MSVDYGRINNTMGKFLTYFGSHENILISVSGGSDSDIIVHIVATYMRDMLPKVHFVNVNTGLEFQATKDHLKYLEEHYDITIERIRGKSVVWAVKHYGVPVLSKRHSQLIDQIRRKVPYTVKLMAGEYNSPKLNSMVSSRNFKAVLAEVEKRNIKVSSKCCYISKKQPLKQYIKENHIDLDVSGERVAEGGIRVVAHSSCFETDSHGLDRYMPLYYWDDETKAYYKESEGIRYSDCYEVWGMKRTGCVGCPYGSNIAQEIRIIEKYEPRLAQACKNVFGESYRLIDDCWCRKDKVFPTEEQISMFDDYDIDWRSNND